MELKSWRKERIWIYGELPLALPITPTLPRKNDVVDTYTKVGGRMQRHEICSIGN